MPSSAFRLDFPSPQPGQPQDFDVAETAWGHEAANLDQNGQRSLESALRLFSLAFGDVPGTSATPDGVPILSASLAIRAMASHWSELTPNQQAYFNTSLAVPSDAFSVEVGPVESTSSLRSLMQAGIFGLPETLPDSLGLATDYLPDVRDDLALLARKARAFIARKMGGNDIPGIILVNFVDCGKDKTVYGCAEPMFHGPPGRQNELTPDGPGACASCILGVTPSRSLKATASSWTLSRTRSFTASRRLCMATQRASSGLLTG